MLNNTGFDLWADGYDKSVGLSDENDRYPFAGYRAMMNALYQRLYTIALEGRPDGGGMVAFNYYSGEPLSETAQGRPMLVRLPDADHGFTATITGNNRDLGNATHMAPGYWDVMDAWLRERGFGR